MMRIPKAQHKTQSEQMLEKCLNSELPQMFNVMFQCKKNAVSVKCNKGKHLKWDPPVLIYTVAVSP